MPLTEVQRAAWELGELQKAQKNCEYNHSIWAVSKELCNGNPLGNSKDHHWSVRANTLPVHGQRCFCGEEYHI